MKNLATALTLCLLFACPSIFGQNASGNKQENENADTTSVIATVMNLYKLKEDITGMIDKLESTRQKGKEVLARIEHKKDSLTVVSKNMWGVINELEKSGVGENLESAKNLRAKVKRIDGLLLMHDKDISYLKNADANAIDELEMAKKRIADIDARIKLVQ